MNEKDYSGEPLEPIRAVPPTLSTVPLAIPYQPVGTHFETPERDLTLPPAETLTMKEALTDKAAVLTAEARTAVDGWKDTATSSVAGWKETAASSVNSWKETVTNQLNGLEEKVDGTKTLINARIASLKSSAQESAGDFQEQLRTDTAKWAGIAAGTGFALGLLGRWLHHRAYHRVPAVLVIEGSC